MMARRLRADPERMHALRLLHLRGEEQRLDYERAQLRSLLMHERRLNSGSERAAELERQIEDAHAQWRDVVTEVRALRSPPT